MNKKLIIFSLLTASLGYSQANKWSIDAGLGLTKAITPLAKGYSTNMAGFLNASVAGRYMFNNKFGVKFEYGYNRFKNDEFGAVSGGPEFRSFMQRFSIEGVLNLGRIAETENFAPRFTFLFHGGTGMTSLKNHSSKWFAGPTKNKSDEFIHLIMGLQPHFKLTNKVSIFADATLMFHVGQSRTFDMTAKNYNRGFDGMAGNMSVGISYKIGKEEEHMDWYIPVDTTLAALERKVADLENRLKDDDNDGVVNARDEEPATTAGVVVDSKGREIKNNDKDNDGMADAYDMCPEQKGPFSANGCPDRDDDGVPDNLDKCPNEKGERSNMGCPGLVNGGLDDLNHKLKNVQFDLNMATIRPESYPALEEVVKEMKAHPDYRLNIVGHADATGPEAFNNVLSVKRAEAVRKYLVGKGVSANSIHASGLGESAPRTTNDTEEGRAINRRVEFEIRK